MDIQAMKEYVSKMLPAYLECAVWSTCGTTDSGYMLDSLEGFAFSSEAKAIAEVDCMYFVRISHSWLDELEPDKCGHMFWLSREGHGSGFFDSGNVYANILQEKAEGMGSAGICAAGLEIEFLE